MIEEVPFSLESITLALLFVATAIFSWITVKSKNIKSFQFQVSMFVFIWLIGVMVNIFQKDHTEHSDLGLQIHLVAMAYLSCFLWLRFYNSRKGDRKILEDLDDDNT
jgi:hypothetical protein